MEIFKYLNQVEVAKKIGKSRPWLNQRLNKIAINKSKKETIAKDKNSKAYQPKEFTEDDKKIVKKALLEIADEIKEAANKL
jgi:hypothetical protein